MRIILASTILFASVASPISAQVINGAQIFKQRCSMCHQVKASGPAVLGPNLAGVVGRKAAATPFKHSPAFAKLSIVWTKDNLDKFIAAPARYVPGTRMAMAISDAAQRKAIIDYLATTR